MVLGHKCSLATGRRWHRCRAGPEKPNPGASLAICCHSRPISSRASYPNCSAFLTLPKSDHVDPFSWEPGPWMEMPDRTASKASHVFGESQIASGQQKKEWDRGKERAQRESWWETETPGRQGWVGCGEGKGQWARGEKGRSCPGAWRWSTPQRQPPWHCISLPPFPP